MTPLILVLFALSALNGMRHVVHAPATIFPASQYGATSTVPMYVLPLISIRAAILAPSYEVPPWTRKISSVIPVVSNPACAK
jgi:hypothetical protein